MDCPQCCNDANQIVLVCDNDCHSMECPDCNYEWYITEEGECGEGHNPICGDDSEDDDGSPQEMDVSE